MTYDRVVIEGKGFPGSMKLDSDVRIVDRGRKQRRQNARGGTRGRRGARPVPPCPMWLFRMKPLPDGEREKLLEQIEAMSMGNVIVLPGEWGDWWPRD